MEPIVDSGLANKTSASNALYHEIKEHVQHIESILAKDILSRKDVSEINRLYQEVDKLERRCDRIPVECNSSHILGKVIQKIKTIARIGMINLKEKSEAKDLISLYHLQSFVDKGLPIKQCFDNFSVKVKRKDQIQKEIATYLPETDSVAEFDEDVATLIGPNSSDKIQRILHHKRILIHEDEKRTQNVRERKLELHKLRETHPQDFPGYMDELLDNRYVHLYNHLIEMRKFDNRIDREKEIEKMTFSEASHVILETRQAIIQKVENTVPPHCKDVLFLVGGSGAGKSTTLCFLRGDEMVLKGNSYESRSDHKGHIGHHQAISCTFLPAVEFVNGWYIIDFPGFDDTHGSLVSLGMECALKALVERHQPKVLVLESITNSEGRFAAAAQLGLRLQRLLDNKKLCTLGITKYFSNPDFFKIEEIEQKQRRERSDPNNEETTLAAVIETLSNLKLDNLQPTIEEKRRELKAMQDKRTQRIEVPLSETTEKKEHRANIKALEEEMLKQIGLGNIISFDHLDDPNRLSKCFSEVSQEKNVCVNSKHPLDPMHMKLVKYLFENDLVKKMGAIKDYDCSIDSFETFEQSVKESSLINTVFSFLNPEIGKFLHLKEIDPTIVRNFDKKIVETCVENYMRAVIDSIDMTLVETIVKEMGEIAAKDKISKLKDESAKLQKYVFGLLGVDLKILSNKERFQAKWDEIRQPIHIALANVEKAYALPVWAEILMGVPLGIPLGIRALLRWNARNAATKIATDTIIDNYCHDLQQMYKVLLTLKNLEKLVKLQEAMDQAFDSVKISDEVFGKSSNEALVVTMKERIEKVRRIYGLEDWDRRVSFLVDSIVIPKNDLCFYADLISYAYNLIEPVPEIDLACSQWRLAQYQTKFKISQGKVNRALAAAALLELRELINSGKIVF